MLQVSSSRFQLQADVFVGGIWILIVYLRGKSNQVAVVSKMQFLTRCKQKQTMLIDGICFLAVYLRGKSNQVAGSSATFGEKVTKLPGGGVSVMCGFWSKSGRDAAVQLYTISQ